MSLMRQSLKRPFTQRMAQRFLNDGRETLQVLRQGAWLLLQKVVTDCLGDFLWGLFVDPKVVKSWEYLRF